MGDGSADWGTVRVMTTLRLDPAGETVRRDLWLLAAARRSGGAGAATGPSTLLAQAAATRLAGHGDLAMAAAAVDVTVDILCHLARRAAVSPSCVALEVTARAATWNALPRASRLLVMAARDLLHAQDPTAVRDRCVPGGQPRCAPWPMRHQVVGAGAHARGGAARQVAELLPALPGVRTTAGALPSGVPLPVPVLAAVAAADTLALLVPAADREVTLRRAGLL